MVATFFATVAESMLWLAQVLRTVNIGLQSNYGFADLMIRCQWRLGISTIANRRKHLWHWDLYYRI